MNLPQPVEKFTPEAYLEWEMANEIKHEYLDGEVFAMSGAKDSHVTVSGNLFILLRNHLRGGPCRVYMVDMKARVEAANCFFYPDVLVTCDSRDRASDYYKSHPVFIAEVLSASTAAFDRGRKFSAYRQLDSLREYLLIDADTPSVDCFRRDDSGHWVLYPYEAGSMVELASMGLSLPIEALYEDVDFDGGNQAGTE